MGHPVKNKKYKKFGIGISIVEIGYVQILVKLSQKLQKKIGIGGFFGGHPVYQSIGNAILILRTYNGLKTFLI